MIDIKKINEQEFLIIIEDKNSRSEHTVTLDNAYFQHLTNGKLTKEGKIGGLKETEVMELARKKDSEINKEKCKSKIFQYLFANQGKTEIKISDIKNSIPNSILLNLPEHLEDILAELIVENNLNGKIEADSLTLY